MKQPYSRTASQPPRQNQLQPYSRQNNQLAPQQHNMFTHFDQMANQMMSHMDQQLATLGFGNIFRGFDDLEQEMNEFSNMHRHMMGLNQRDVNQHARDGAFQVYSQCFVQSSKMGPDGRMIQEKYFDNNAVARGTNGHTISERQQGYKNSDGIDRFAHERMMNDKGRKHLRERDRTGQVTTTNHYLNMDENQVEAFENEWLGMGRSIGFQAPPRDMNQLPFPRPQLAQGSYAPIRRNDLQPVMLGGNRPHVANALPPSTNTPPRAALQQPGVEQRVPLAYDNHRSLGGQLRNQEITGVYQNRAPKNQHPKAG